MLIKQLFVMLGTYMYLYIPYVTQMHLRIISHMNFIMSLANYNCINELEYNLYYLKPILTY